MKKVVYLLSFMMFIMGLSSCVIAPVYPGQRAYVVTTPDGHYYYNGYYYHHRVWIKGHWHNHVWVPGHWYYYR